MPGTRFVAVLIVALALVVVGCNPGGAGETTSPTSVTRGYDY